MTRYVWGLAFLVSWFTLVAAKDDTRLHTQESHAELAYKTLEKLDETEARNTRFLSYYNYEPKSKILARRIATMKFWVNQVHFGPTEIFPVEVPGSDGTLYALDIRNYLWNKGSWQAVARREPYFREPGIDSATAILLRRMIGVEQDPKSLHSEAIVRADWFFRETMESDRSQSYYDLLFAKQRFVTTLDWAKGADGDYVKDPSDTANGGYKVVKSFKFVNFPKNELDFESAFGVDKARKFIKDTKINLQHGAVVEGIEKGVSIVARQNRLVERTQGFIGAYYKTYDVKETSGKRDFAETLNKDFEFDAGEILADLPGGGMAALLVDSKGKIVETADNRFATDSSDLKFDARVRTPGSCFICHELKYIKPKNLVEEMVKAGIDIKFKDKVASLNAKSFFLGWVEKLENEQNVFTKYISKTSGFRPGENATNLKLWRDEYDEPVNLAKAAKESGMSEAAFKTLAVQSTKARVLMLVRGFDIPRKTWEVDVYREIQLLYNASKK